MAVVGLGLLAGCGGVTLSWQRQTKMPRIGYLALTDSGGGSLNTIRDALRDLGYVEGQTIVFDERWAESTDQLAPLAAELTGLPVDLIVASGSAAIQAAMSATRTIPIVFPSSADPVRSGHVASLAHPGGNVTGASVQGPQVTGKRLQLLREMVPGISRVMFLTETAASDAAGNLQEAREAAQAQGVQLLEPVIRTAADLSAAFEVAANQAQALLPSGTALVVRERAWIIEFAMTARLPLMSGDRVFTVEGGLASYGANRIAQYRRAGASVDKILKGAKPADLPVEQPTEFDFVINLKTARAIGLTIPPSVLQQATEIIQ